MIEICKNCGTMYNNQTVNHCPACRPKKKKRNRSGRRNEIQEFMRRQIAEKKSTVNSFRRAEVSKYEREKGKQVYNKF